LKESFQKILIIQTAFIGDVILATSVIEKLSTHYPEARIDFLLRKGNEGLLQNNPGITRIFIWDKKKNKNRNLFRILGKIRKEKYDLVVNLQRFFSSGLLTAFSNGRIKVGFNKNPFSFTFTSSVKHFVGQPENFIHEVERNHSLIAPYTNAKVLKPRLYPSEYDAQAISQYQTCPYICIAPASVWFTKQYPKEKWIEFINSVPETYKVYLLGGVQDKLLCNEIIGSSDRKGVEELCGKLSFLESAALMKDAKMNYVNDSAPLHIASSMNAPVCAVFCSTIPAFGFGPLSDSSKIVEVKEMTCRPCGLHGHKKCPEGHFKCGYKIDNKELLYALNN
jgi:heptosyltransferase-2